MQVKSLENIDLIIKKTDAYRLKKKNTDKLILLDKVNILLSFIIQQNFYNWDIKDYEPIPLHSKILKTAIDDFYKNIIKLLIDNDIIKTNGSYITKIDAAKENYIRKSNGLLPNIKAHSIKYGLTKTSKKLKVVNVEIIVKKRKEKYKDHLKKKYNGYMKNPIHSKILNNLFQLKFNCVAALEELKKIQNEGTKTMIRYYEDSYDMLCKMNDYTTMEEYFLAKGFYYTQSELVDRVFHFISTIPKVFRKHLFHKTGEVMAEIDLSNAQPLLIGLEFILTAQPPIFKDKSYVKEGKSYVNEGNKDICGVLAPSNIICGVLANYEKEHERLFDDLINGNFYEKISQIARKNNDLEFYNLYKNNYKEFKKIVLGEGLYFYLLPKDRIKPAEKYLMEMYPLFMEYIRKLKRENSYKSIPIKAQKNEAKIFVGEFFNDLDNDFFAIPVHDSILTLQSNVKYVESRLKTIMQTQYPFLSDEHLTNLFTVEDLKGNKIKI